MLSSQPNKMNQQPDYSRSHNCLPKLCAINHVRYYSTQSNTITPPSEGVTTPNSESVIQNLENPTTTTTTSSSGEVISSVEQVLQTGQQVVASSSEPYWHSFITYNTYQSTLHWYEHIMVPIQFGLEFLQHHTGLPWWGVITLASFLLRVFMFPLQIAQTKTSTVMQTVMPKVKAYQEKAAVLKQVDKKNSISVVESYTQIQKIYAENGVKTARNMMISVAQLPVYIITFVSIRAICLRPEWALELSTGGIWWFKDLTVPDPYYLLPLLSAIGLLIAMEMQMGATGQKPGLAMKWFSRIFPFFFMCITIQFPAGVNVYWASSSIFAVLTTLLFKIQWIRKFLGIPLLQDTDADAAAATTHTVKQFTPKAQQNSILDVQKFSRKMMKKNK